MNEETELSYGPGEWREIGQVEAEEGMEARPPDDQELRTAYLNGYAAGLTQDQPANRQPHDMSDWPL